MNIAIIGAGRIGSTFAFYLARGGHQVTVVARGARLATLQRSRGITSVAGQTAALTVTDSLDASVPYDLVLVTVLAHQVDAVLPSLKSSAAKTVMFMFNTFEKIDRLRDEVGGARFAFAFPNMMAFFAEDGALKSTVNAPGMVTTMTSAPWADVFAKAGLPTEVEPDMNSFLRTHVAMVVPMMVAATLVYQRATQLTWLEATRLSAALVEGFEVVRELGHSLRPGAMRMLALFPRVVLTFFIWLVARAAAVKNLGEFGPTEPRALIDAMTAAAPGRTANLLAIRP